MLISFARCTKISQEGRQAGSFILCRGAYRSELRVLILIMNNSMAVSLTSSFIVFIRENNNFCH